MITFSYKISDFVDAIKGLSEYRVVSQMSQAPESAVDDLVLTENNEPDISRFLKTGCIEIAELLSGYTKDLIDTDNVTILNSFEFDVTYNAVEHSIVFRVNMPATFRTSATKLIDDSIMDGLNSYMIYRINKFKGIEFATYLDDWKESKNRIRGFLCQRTEPIVRSKQLF